MTVASLDERDAIYNRTVTPLAEVMQRIAVAAYRGETQSREVAFRELHRYIAQVLAMCWLMGARRAVLLARAAEREAGHRAEFGTTVAPFVPAIPFEEAVNDVLRREPMLVDGYQDVQALYEEHHAFVLAKSADARITERVRDIVARALKNGAGGPQVYREIADLGGWTRGYAENVFRTNSATAYTAGTVAQSQDKDIAQVMKAFEYQYVHDSDVRDNHKAAGGLIASVNDPIWDTYAPPQGWNCRCDLRLVSKYELEELGLYAPSTGTIIRRVPSNFAAAGPDPGFKTGGIAGRLALG